jgi:hypothetical protein
MLTDVLFQGHSLYVAGLVVELDGGTLLSVVSGLGALMKTPYYQQEEQLHHWGDKNDKRMK